MGRRRTLWFVLMLAVSFVSQIHKTNAKTFVSPSLKTSSRHSSKGGQLSQKLAGHAATLLPSGKVLLTGGESGSEPSDAIAILDPASGTISNVQATLVTARAWHTATLLPDGTVLILGGIGAHGKFVTTAEVFDPTLQASHQIPTPNLLARAHHTTTLLTEGRVLVAGGQNPKGDLTDSVQILDPVARSVETMSRRMLVPRQGHTAVLEADGTILFWDGQNDAGETLTFGEIFDPYTQGGHVESSRDSLQPSGGPFIEASIPANNSSGVLLTARVALRFSRPLAVQTVNSNTFDITGPGGAVDAKVVPAEDGMLAFITPSAELRPGTTYIVNITGARDLAGNEIASTTIAFATAGSSAAPVLLGGASGVSDDGGSRSLDDTFHRLPALQAPTGVTALAGQVLKLNAAPLPHVLLQIDGQSTYSDATGRFLLENITPGHHAMLIDGGPAAHDGLQYGIYDDGVDVTAGQTNVLKYKVWMTPLDLQHEVTIPSPTTSEFVVTTPKLPGLELHLPSNTVIKDRNGNVVTRLSITPIPVNRPPFPLPAGGQAPIYFTIQPGGASIDMPAGSWVKGARLIYPNSFKATPGSEFDFWNYDPDQKGWYVYGEGTVSANGESVVPNPGVEIYRFTGAMFENTGVAPGTFPFCSHQINAPCPSDPVDLSTGIFVYNKTDLVLPDVIPLIFTRTYRPQDSESRSFGVGAADSYELYLVGDATNYSYVELILPDGFPIHFYRTSSGTSYVGAVFAHTGTQTEWYGATVTYNTSAFPGAAWVLTTKYGTNYYFPDGFTLTNPSQAALLGIRDRNGNTVTIARVAGAKTQITLPNGRYLSIVGNPITQIADNSGRTVQYQYDALTRIEKVIDAAGGVWQYSYDSNSNMQTITDPRGIAYLTNQYDAFSRVTQQTLADGGTYQFVWTPTPPDPTTQRPFTLNGIDPEGGSPSVVETFRTCTSCTAGYLRLISSVQVTDPKGNVEVAQFNTQGLPTSVTFASGKPEEQTFTYQYFADNLLQNLTDQLGRVTSYQYDANGNLTSLTNLTGTPNAVTASAAYDPIFNQVTSMTDPLGNTTIFGYDTLGNLTSITDPLSHQTTLTHDAQGNVLSVADPLGNTASFTYFLGDLTSITDPLSRTTNRFLDGAGRVLTSTSPLGQTRHYAYNSLNQVTSITDPLNGQTSFTYDANGNLLTLTDANSHTTTYTYNNMDRVATRTDALTNSASYQYDLNGNLSQFTDRRGKVDSYSYDGINRLTFAGYGTTAGPTYESTVTNTYDAGNRLTQTVDSITGTIMRAYDGLDRLTSETTPGSNTVSYSYDAAGRRASLTVPGQTAVSYTFDNANRLTQISQGSTTVSFAYDAANRRTTLTLPNGVTTTYSYDNASQLTGLTYANGSMGLGNLTYTYDLNGRRANQGGSLAATGMPAQLSISSYNANNQLTVWGTANLYYDANGNMTSDGTHSYTWDARNRLTQIDLGSTASFAYDPFGRRTSKTILSTQTGFLYDFANPVQESSGSSVTANLLAGGIDEVFQRTDFAGARNFLTNALGSTFALTDPSGTIQSSYTFEPFGNTTLSGSSTTNSFGFTSRELDLPTLYYYRARFYSTSLQRFISEDPIGFSAGDVNLYAYTHNSPTNHTDSSGKIIDLNALREAAGNFALQHADYIPAVCSADSFRFYGGGLEGGNENNAGAYRLDNVHYSNGHDGWHVNQLENDLLFEGGDKQRGFGVVTDLSGRKPKEGLVFVPLLPVEGKAPYLPLDIHGDLGFVGGVGSNGFSFGFYGDAGGQLGGLQGAGGGGWSVNFTSAATCLKGMQ